MFRAVLEWLVAQLAAGLGVTGVKGYPNWARPDAAPPITAVQFSGRISAISKRIGQRPATRGATYRLWVFARHEPELADLMDRLDTWETETFSAEINGRRVDVNLAEMQRYQPETEAQQEQYAATGTVTITW